MVTYLFLEEEGELKKKTKKPQTNKKPTNPKKHKKTPKEKKQETPQTYSCGKGRVSNSST